MHNAIGFGRGVIVHSAIYGADHRLLLHALESLNDRQHYRGIGIVIATFRITSLSECTVRVSAELGLTSSAF